MFPILITPTLKYEDTDAKTTLWALICFPSALRVTSWKAFNWCRCVSPSVSFLSCSGHSNSIMTEFCTVLTSPLDVFHMCPWAISPCPLFHIALTLLTLWPKNFTTASGRYLSGYGELCTHRAIVLVLYI